MIRTVVVAMMMASGALLTPVSWEHLVTEGKYDFVDLAILQNFLTLPMEVSPSSPVMSFPIRRAKFTGDVKTEMRREGLRPATFRELLQLGIDKPQLQCACPMVALGTQVSVLSVPRVAVLDCPGGQRILASQPDRLEDLWEPPYCFAAVRITPRR